MTAAQPDGWAALFWTEIRAEATTGLSVAGESAWSYEQGGVVLCMGRTEPKGLDVLLVRRTEAAGVGRVTANQVRWLAVSAEERSWGWS